MTTKRKNNTLDQYFTMAVKRKRDSSSSLPDKGSHESEAAKDSESTSEPCSSNSEVTDSKSKSATDEYDSTENTIKTEIIKLCEKRGLLKTCCPSEVGNITHE